MDGTGEALLTVSALLVNARRPEQSTARTRNLLLARGPGMGEGETGQGRQAAVPTPWVSLPPAGLGPTGQGFFILHAPALGWIMLSDLGPPT